MYYEFQKEIQKKISKSDNETIGDLQKETKKYDNNINFDTIAKLKNEGKQVRAMLMKNHYVAFVITSPLWRYYENGDIDEKLFQAGLKYSQDYFISIQDNRARQIFDIMSGGFSDGNKEPSQRQIEASIRVERVRKELDKKSKYIKPHKHFKGSKKCKSSKNVKIVDKRYREIIGLFLEKEVNMKDTKDVSGKVIKMGMKTILKTRNSTIKGRIIEALGILATYY